MSDDNHKTKVADQLEIHSELRPGDLGRIIELHGSLYTRECGWNSVFEAYVAHGLAKFVLHNDPRTHRLWIAELSGRLVGSIAIVGRGSGTAQLRWFLLDPIVRRQGYGRRLLDIALEFCREISCHSVFLWTVAGLDASAHLYRAAGFRLTEEREQGEWGPRVTEQRYDLQL